MTPFISRRMLGFALGGILAVMAGGCSDVPSGPPLRSGPRPESTVPSPADRAVQEVVTVRSITEGAQGQTEASTFTLTTMQGRAQLDPGRLSATADGMAPLSLAVWDAGTRGAPVQRRTRMRIRLPDNNIAIVEREALNDGTPTTLHVRVGEREFVWTRSWVRRNGMNRLVRSEVESSERGVRLVRSTLLVSPSQISRINTRADRTGAQLLAWSRQFGSLAGTVLLPRSLHAQTYGMACDGASKALNAAWIAWRIATVAWFTSFAWGGSLKTTAAELTAAAAVEVAEANYIDCYVKAAAAGIPDKYIVPPPEQDEL